MGSESVILACKARAFSSDGLSRILIRNLFSRSSCLHESNSHQRQQPKPTTSADTERRRQSGGRKARGLRGKRGVEYLRGVKGHPQALLEVVLLAPVRHQPTPTISTNNRSQNKKTPTTNKRPYGEGFEY